MPVPTHVADQFEVKAGAIEAAITPRAKAVLLGNPNNPTGAVIERTELKQIAGSPRARSDRLCDEVYSRLVYGGAHTCIAALPGMRERTILVDGFSKAYAMTGWRIGYACAPRPSLEAMLKVHQYAIMCAPTMSQAAAKSSSFSVFFLGETEKTTNLFEPFLSKTSSATLCVA